MSNKLSSVGIIGIGSCLPERILSNFDLEKMVETSDEWIMQRTGISQRRILERDQPAFELGVTAAQRAIEDAGISPEEIGLIIATTGSPDYHFPSTACLIQGRIGAVNAGAIDMNAACSGFVYGITFAKQFISTNTYNYVLVVSCEGLSKIIDWEDRNTCVLFGDCAAAAVLGKADDGYGILSHYLGADGTPDNCYLMTSPCCYISEAEANKRKHENKQAIWMSGGSVMKFAIRIMDRAIRKVVDDAQLTLDDIKYVVPHQANIRIIEDAAKSLGIGNDKMFCNIRDYGNVSSATIPLALDKMSKNGLLSKGDNIVVVGFGSGLTWAAALVRWCR
ncbi:MAG: beta-ketoacyl-ACP synthase III [Bacillota bacterium]|nr:beta-ketoacyl-ACP synthase III [Bacillota bacterium]